MKNTWLFLLIVLLGACQQKSPKIEEKKEKAPTLAGHWQFLDKYGNYNEAYFADTLYQTMNRFVDRNVLVKYYVEDDTLHSVMEMRGGDRVILAGLEWLDRDHVVIATEFVSDTLVRMKNPDISLQNTDPFTDSVTFFNAFYTRYENFLVEKGIITPEEAKAFREQREVPGDVLRKSNGQ